MHELTVITITAASIGLLHTLLGPDHYLPFIVMARARKWSLVKTTCITALCGAGHVLSSIILGIIGIALGISINKLGAIESFRGGLAAWLLIAFGAGYFIWGVFRARKNRPHKHWHAHGDTDMPIHKHAHSKDHLHVHKGEKAKNLTPWILFTIFVFGPCEPLIPLLIYPAAKKQYFWPGAGNGCILRSDDCDNAEYCNTSFFRCKPSTYGMVRTVHSCPGMGYNMPLRNSN